MGRSEKRTKSDEGLRQADQVEKRPEQNPNRRKPREDFGQGAARIVREATENPNRLVLWPCACLDPLL